MKVITIIVLILIVILLSTVYGCDAIGPGGGGSKPTNSDYTVLTNDMGVLTLSQVGKWEGRDNKEVEFDSNGPLIVEYRATSVSSISSGFDVSVMQREGKAEYGMWNKGTMRSPWQAEGVNKGRRYFVVNASGHFKLTVKSHGCEWWVRIGRE